MTGDRASIITELEREPHGHAGAAGGDKEKWGGGGVGVGVGVLRREEEEAALHSDHAPVQAAEQGQEDGMAKPDSCGFAVPGFPALLSTRTLSGPLSAQRFVRPEASCPLPILSLIHI